MSLWDSLINLFHSGVHSAHLGFFTFQLHHKKDSTPLKYPLILILSAAHPHFSHAAAEGSRDNTCISESLVNVTGFQAAD